MTIMPVARLHRVRWAVRLVLTLGVAVSVVGNILHAPDNLVSQAIAAWPPLALLLTVELISRVPVHRRTLAVVRWLSTAVIAGIAAWVSYWHMAAVCVRYGETGASAYLLPLSVDGLVVVASICLVELTGRIRAAAAAGVVPTAAAAADVEPDTAAAREQEADTRTDMPADTEADRPPARPARPPDRPAARTGRPPVHPDTAARIAAAIAAAPDADQDTIAAAAGVSDRTVRRYLAARHLAAA